MPSLFNVTVATNTLVLDAQRQGQATFTVANTSGRQVRGRARVAADQPEILAWLTVVEPAERDFAVPAAEQMAVQVAVPATAAPGTYSFRMDVAEVTNPDENFTRGPSVRFEVTPAPPPPPPRPFPWWIVALVAAVVVVGGTLVLLFTRQAPTPPEPTPGQPTPTEVPAATSTPSPPPEATATPTPEPADLQVVAISNPTCVRDHRTGALFPQFVRHTITIRNIGRGATGPFGPFSTRINLDFNGNRFSLEDWARRFNAVVGTPNLDIANLGPLQDAQITIEFALRGATTYSIEAVTNSGTHTIPEPNTSNNINSRSFNINCP